MKTPQTALRHPAHTQRAVIYCRVSKDDLRNGRSVGEQEERSRELCEKEGWQIVEVFVDNNVSASRFTKKQRAQYESMRQFLREGHADILVLWEVSRSSRILRMGVELVDFCRDNSILIHVVKDRHTYDVANRRRDRENLIDDFIDAERESEKTSERVKRAIDSNARNGIPHGKVLYGYERIKDHRGQLIEQVIKEEEAAIVREIADRMVKGHTFYAIAKDLNDRGVKPPQAKRWQGADVRRIVLTPSYIGKRVHQGGKKAHENMSYGDATWPAILDEATWQACVNRVTDQKRLGSRDTRVKHLVSGIAVCGKCGEKLKTVTNNGYPSYRCYINHCASITIAELEKYVSDVMRNHMLTLEISEEVNANEEEEREAAKAEADQLKERLDDAYNAWTGGILSASDYTRFKNDLEPQLNAALARSRTESIPKQVRKIIAQPEKWDGMDLAEKRELIRLTLDIAILPVGRGKRPPTTERVNLTDVRTGQPIL